MYGRTFEILGNSKFGVFYFLVFSQFLTLGKCLNYSHGRKSFNFSLILSLSKTVKPKVILVLSYIKRVIFFDIINRVVFFDGPYLDKSILMYIMSYFFIIFIYLFIIIQTSVAMNKVKTIYKVNLSMMIKSQEELNHT